MLVNSQRNEADHKFSSVAAAKNSEARLKLWGWAEMWGWAKTVRLR